VIQALGRAGAAATLSALLAAAWLAVWYAWHPALIINLNTDPPAGLVSGLYPVERNDEARLTFAWTKQDVTIRLPGLDRRVDWILTLRARGARAVAAENPHIDVFADGVSIGGRQLKAEFEDVAITIPATPQRRRGLVIALHSSRTFVPGPSDPRPLAMMLDWISLAPSGAVLAPRAAIAGAAVSAGAMGAAIALLGVTAGSAVIGAVLVSAGDAAVIARGFGPFTAFPWKAARLGCVIAVALVLIAWTTERLRRQSLRNTARFAAAFSAGALFLKLLVLLHPDMPIGDTLFQAHRFQAVLGGNLFFTSIAPGGYSFPYSPGLYVFAAPFARFVRWGPAHMALLRIVVCSADAVAAVLLYRTVTQAWGDRLTAAMAVALYQLLIIGFGVIRAGNLTNAFAQSLAVVALVVMSSPTLRLEHRMSVVLLTLLLAAAYLSHTSTLAILFVATICIAVLFQLRGGPALRSPSAAVLIATVLASILAIALYYGHFMTTYRSEFLRLSQETASAAVDAGGRTISDRLSTVPYYLDSYFGVAAIALSAIGCWWMRRLRDRLTLAIAGWGLSCALFMAIGILTPMDMRYYFAAVPVVALTGAYSASRAWKKSAAWRSAAVILLVGTVAAGVNYWWSALG
jgi:hypothetical protein